MEGNNEVVYLYLDDIIPNRFQPREVFDDQALKELAVSIKEHGVIQPIIVRKVENKYEIIAGERRYKASTMAGLTKIPAIVKNLDDKESSKVALIENLQRRDLTPIEEARTYQKILELEDGMTQEQLAQTMGKTQSVVSNKLRLLALPDEVQDALLKEKVSERHARSLLNISNKNDQIKMLDKIIAERMTVRELDKEIKDMNDNQGQSSNATLNLFETMNSTNNNSSVSEDKANNPVTFSFNNVKPMVVDNTQSSANNSVPETNNSFNPTSVDINKIRENAVDISGPKVPNVDVKDLMKDTTNNSSNDFKFLSSNDSGFKPLTESNDNKNSLGGPLLSPNNQSSETASSGNLLNSLSSSSDLSGLFGSAIPKDNQESSSNNNIASSMSSNTFSFNPFGGTKKDVTVAINDIKDTVKSIETKGYNVTVEENDSGDSYQITIKVNKNV